MILLWTKFCGFLCCLMQFFCGIFLKLRFAETLRLRSCLFWCVNNKRSTACCSGPAFLASADFVEQDRLPSHFYTVHIFNWTGSWEVCCGFWANTATAARGFSASSRRSASRSAICQSSKANWNLLPAKQKKRTTKKKWRRLTSTR